MKPETSGYLAKAREDLSDARTTASIGLAKVAARLAYYAVLHAAEAFIVERTGRIAKTHSGVRSTLAKLSVETSEIDRNLLTFLSQAYKYKEISDYGIGSDATVTTLEAQDAIAKAEIFIRKITASLEAA